MDVIGHGEAVSELLELANTLMNNMHEQEAKGVLYCSLEVQRQP